MRIVNHSRNMWLTMRRYYDTFLWGGRMNLKSSLIKLMEESGNDYVSGSRLASSLSVSRSAIWKAVEGLRAEGYEVSAVTNRGYRLTSAGDVLSQMGIKRYIDSRGVFSIEVRKSVTSTNTVVRELAAKGAHEGYVLAAEEQTSGKGRLGRSFYSPAGYGAYFSLLLRPGVESGLRQSYIGAGDAALITSAAAVATARAIEAVFNVRVGIKWVNDLMADDKKVCGILTEASIDIESGSVDNAVLGIGINISEPDNGYPDAIKDVAAPLIKKSTGGGNQRCRLIAATLDNFWAFYTNLARREFLEEYRERSVVTGRDIFILSGNKKTPAHALEIDDDCRLLVRCDNGEITALNAGEVSVRV